MVKKAKSIDDMWREVLPPEPEAPAGAKTIGDVALDMGLSRSTTTERLRPLVASGAIVTAVVRGRRYYWPAALARSKQRATIKVS